jgi:hypothetical protein
VPILYLLKDVLNSEGLNILACSVKNEWQWSDSLSKDLLYRKAEKFEMFVEFNARRLLEGEKKILKMKF